MGTMTEPDRRFNPKHRDSLVSDERNRRWNPSRLLALAGLQAQRTVLDLGCGPGFWTLPIAEIVGAETTVYALDVSEEMLAALIEQNPPLNVRTVQAELPSIPLPDASVDFIWAAFVFHEVQPPAVHAMEMYRVLRSGGRIAVLDWHPNAKGQSGPPRHHRFSPQQVEEFLRAAGFNHIQHAWQDEDAYLLLIDKLLQPGENETQRPSQERSPSAAN